MEQEQAMMMGSSLLKTLALFMEEGGVFMWVIFATWALGMGVALDRFLGLFRYDTRAGNLMAAVKRHVMLNDVAAAIVLCSKSKALLPEVFKSGLKRANQDKEQISDAVEATVLGVVPKVERRLSYLALLANISTLLGLLGTIYGLIESFAAVAQADPSTKAKLLALGIAKAMNTTAFGLISAIFLMVIHSFLASKAERITTEIDEYAVKLIDLLGMKKISDDQGRRGSGDKPEFSQKAA